MTIRYGSVCSGIEAASVAWHPLGWQASFLSEIEAFPRAVLQHHYPETPLHGDFTTIQAGDYAAIDLLVGGTPCQDFSVAGLRKGLDGERGNLTLEYLRLAQRLRPRWLVWENVPGVLSIDGGRAFGAILGGLVELGYGFAYRVLDAQYFGVAQRRRRVFVVGYAGDWRPAAAVLFERHSLQGHPAPSREARAGSASGAEGRAFALGSHAGAADADQSNRSHAAGGPVGSNISEELAYSLRAGRGQSVAYAAQVAGTLNANGKAAGSATSQDAEAGLLIPVAYRTSGNCGAWATGDRVDALTTGTDPNSHLVQCVTGDITHTLKAEGFDASEDGTGRGQPIVNQAAGVRRLTPREAERLQGFPDDYTLIPWRGKPAGECPDGPRYKALGNSMAVPVMAWICRRIQMVDALTHSSADAA